MHKEDLSKRNTVCSSHPSPWWRKLWNHLTGCDEVERGSRKPSRVQDLGRYLLQMCDSESTCWDYATTSIGVFVRNGVNAINKSASLQQTSSR
jgi:hypothetical protein